MKLNTKRAIELDNADFSLLKAIERKYNVLLTITDAGRVDKYEREQSERELYDSSDVDVDGEADGRSKTE